MNKEQVVSWLKDICQTKDWFHSIDYDQYGRVVVYVKYMNAEVLRAVPDWTEDHKQVLCHFAASAPNADNKFVSKPQEKCYSPYNPPAPHGEIIILSQAEAKRIGFTSGDLLADTEEQDKQLELSVQVLTDELDCLEKICGSNILADIFFEEGDGKNAVTNLSAKFPEVRDRMHQLFLKYGFDLLYDQLEL